MAITGVQWHAYRIPLRSNFATAHSMIATREGAVVEVTTEGGISGIGEIAPLPQFGGGSLSEALHRLPSLAAPLYRKRLDEALDSVRAASESGYKEEAASCGLEIALLDALGKTKGCSIGILLSSVGFNPRPMVAVNAVVGAKTTQEAVIGAREAVAAGFPCVKLKVGREVGIQDEIERVSAVRQAIGPDIHLRLDANEAWSLEQAITILSGCAAFDIQYVEQPLKACDLAGMRTLRQAAPIRVAADEALTDVESACRIFESEAADILIVKPQLSGGLRTGRRIIQEAAQRGMSSVVTGTIETGIGLVAALQLAAASPEITLECGLATHHLLIDDLLVDDLSIRNGFFTVPAGPGLGVLLDRGALAKYSWRP